MLLVIILYMLSFCYSQPLNIYRVLTVLTFMEESSRILYEIYVRFHMNLISASHLFMSAHGVMCLHHRCLRCHLFSCNSLHAFGISSSELTSLLCFVNTSPSRINLLESSPGYFFSFITKNVSNMDTCSSCQYWKKVAVKATTWSMF